MTDTAQVERRTFIMDGCKIETRAEGNDPCIIGHAAVFDQLSENLGGFREMVKPGAFSESIEQDDVRALINHNTDLIIGRNRANTLTLAEDEQGLAIEIIPPDTQAGRDLMTSMERGDITQMSFGFRVRAGGQEWGEDEEGNIIRTLTDIKLFEVSPVTFPAYTQTDAAVRSLNEYKENCQRSSQYYDECRAHRLRLLELTA